MTNTAWESLSNQAIGAAGIVYFLALLVLIAEWASLRQVAVAEASASTESSGDVALAVRTGDGGADAEARERRTAFLGRLGLMLTGIAAAVHFVALLGRGMAASPNRVPWGNMYEFTISGTFVVTLFFLVLMRKYALQWMAPLIVAFVVTTLMVGVIWLHADVAPLTEALNSYWLVIHVVSAVIATGAFTIGGLLSIVYLVKLRRGGDAGAAPGSRIPTLAVLDRTAYRIHAFAFPVWTFAVLITGPIWAHEAWSRYWNWDPKEVWAFITWVVYAAYLHARATAGWKGRNAAILACVGLATLWFNFIGINYFSTSSQHSYAGGEPTSQVVRQDAAPPGVDVLR
ncbi:c-type cytochrome biogenesis protein CcsB [Nocardioides sp.]|uniref:c-type cytochrome biogenesis protein CcsB n=1 Tax=Nocardioides sp. TaxID=35761 RepID=UPI0027268AB2|nr:c-type cytochrome biogenesis protein CcsB [Nocardioides sp.]MDO9455489.1 c-type cytochrome biogenesis protein CcsB [Nocardioides sp.]